MLSYDEALARILATVPGALPAEAVPLLQARTRVLAKAVYADSDLPSFDNSAVDGFAVRLTDAQSATEQTPVTLPIIQTVAAGATSLLALGSGEAARILTGAPVPPGADAILMVEDTTVNGESVILRDKPSAHFIRRVGSDIARGTLALESGRVLDAGAIGLLAALNRAMVPCVRRPMVAVLTTGDELIPVGVGELLPGQIRDSNGPALLAAIDEAGGVVSMREHVADNAEAVRSALERAADKADIILTSGGVSVGEHDYVKAAVEELGGLDFWRIAIKPGKPLAFGKVRDTLFFGLPGNPVSTLVTFELFVRPLLRKWSGHTELIRRQAPALLTEPLPHEPGRREFVRARLTWTATGFHATLLGAQGSHRLTSLAGADALLIANENHGDYAAEESLPALLLC